LGGRCAEKYFFKEVTTGAYDDFEKAYNLAHQIVTKFGMHEEIGYIAFP
jgi:ATP-dependent Zn protease